MKSRTLTLLFMLLALIVTLLGMAAGIYFNSPSPGEPITLPQKTDGESIDIEEIRRENVRVVEAVTVDENNVLELVSQLKRPLEYHFSTENTVWSGENSRTTVTEGYVKGTNAKVTQLENGTETVHYLVTDNRIYLWEAGKRSYETLGKGSFSYDDMTFVAPYEALPQFEKIEKAALVDNEGQLFIEVTAQREGSDISESYKISVSTGLVSEIAFTKGQEMLAKTTVNLIGTDEIAESVFLLPDNSSPK